MRGTRPASCGCVCPPGSSALIVAGIDVGNHTTEIVLARIRDGAVEPLAHGQAPTRGRKGSRESLEGAVALLHKLEVDATVAVDELVLATLRPVDTSTVALPPSRDISRRFSPVTRRRRTSPPCAGLRKISCGSTCRSKSPGKNATKINLSRCSSRHEELEDAWRG